MKRYFYLIVLILLSLSLSAGERQIVWPKGKMPHRQAHRIAAMTDEAGSYTHLDRIWEFLTSKGFNQ